MNFLNRLKYYLIGVFLGILMVLAIFKDRKLTSWTPQNQVKKEIEEKNLKIDSLVLCRFNCAGYEDMTSVKGLLISGSVDFSNSDVKNHEKRMYHLTFKDSDVLSSDLIFSKEVIEIKSVELTKTSCNCP